MASIENARWAAYATAGAATAVASASEANAVIVYHNVDELVRVSVDLESLASGFSLAFVHSFNLGGYTLYGGIALKELLYFSVVNNGSKSAFAGVQGFSANGNRYAAKLDFGAVITGKGITDTLASGDAIKVTLAIDDGVVNSQWLSAGEGYIGFSFTTAEGLQTGWARITLTGDVLNSFTVEDYAYTTAGEALTAGAIPEPGSLGLLALGSAGLIAWRRRRGASTKASLSA